MNSESELKSNILILVSEERESEILEQILHGECYFVVNTACSKRAKKLIASGRVDVVLCGDVLPESGWKDILETIHNCPHNPKLIVCSRKADEHLWAEVLNRGGYDVLAEPFESEEVRRVVTNATARKTVAGSSRH